MAAVAAQAPLPFIESVSDVVLCERIDSGASGVVSRALYAGAYTIACKTVQVAHMDDGERERVRRQLCATARHYAHANIVRYLGVDVHSDAPRAYHLFMEYFQQTLRSLVHRRAAPFAARVAACFARQLAQALSHLHGTLGVVHRDVKSENIFMHASPRDECSWMLKLGDFGESREIAPPTVAPLGGGASGGGATGAECAAALLSRRLTPNRGTPEYMAPEMVNLGSANGEEPPTQYTAAVDVWSAGLVLFEMLSGDVPYRSERINRFALLEHVAGGARPQWPPSVARPAPGSPGAQLVALYEQCTRQRAAERPSAAALAHTAAAIEHSALAAR